MSYDALKTKEMRRWHTKIVIAKRILHIKQKKKKQQTNAHFRGNNFFSRYIFAQTCLENLIFYSLHMIYKMVH